MFRPSLSLQFGGCSTPLELGNRAIKTKVAQSKTHAPQRTKTKTLFARLFREGKKIKAQSESFFCLCSHPWTVSLANGEQAQGSGNFIHITYTYMYIHLPPSLTFFWLELCLANFLGFCFHGLFIFAYTYQNIVDTHTYCLAFSSSLSLLLKHKDIGKNKNRKYVREKQKLSCWQPHGVEFFSMPQRVCVCLWVYRNFHFVARVRLPPAPFLPIWRYRRFICPVAA